MTHVSEAHRWADQLDDLVARIAPRFRRIEPRRRAQAYLRGLLAPLERKNGWHLAEAAGDTTPDGVQDFLSRMHWDADALRDDLRDYVVDHLGDHDAVLVLDETGFLKKGDKSVGVKRQYSGTAGRIENAQIGVFLAYASRHGHALIDRALFLPETWAFDAARRMQAGVPEEVMFSTKPKQGQAMLKRAFAAGVPCAWVVSDSLYGADSQTRRLVEAHGRGYVLAVTSAQRLGLKPVEEWLGDVPAKGWMRLSAGDGAKGPRLYDWAYLPYGIPPTGWKSGLLIRRKKGRPHQFTFYLTWAPADTDPPSRWWTPLLSSCGSWKVFDDEDETRFYPRVQTRGCCTFREQRSTSHADRNRAGDFSLHAAQLAGGCEGWSTSIQGWEQNAIAQRLSHGLSGRSGGGDRAAAA